MWDRFPPRVRKIITSALDEAAAREQIVATTEHLLLAIARDPESAAVFMFEEAGVAPQRLIERLEVKTSAATTPRAQSFDDNALQVLKSAVAEADRRGDRHVGTEHIALALSRSNGTLASQALAELGFTPDRAEA